MEFEFLQKAKNPDFSVFREVLEGKRKAKRVHHVELFADEEIREYITEKYFGKRWVPNTEETKEEYWKQEIEFWYRMGYDYIRVAGGLSFSGKRRKTEDTAELSKGERDWVEEKEGVIKTWEDFEKYQWPEIKNFDFFPYEFVSKNLPEGMKMVVCPSSGVFEIASETLLGFENMSYLLYEDFSLVQAVFDKVGSLIEEFYREIVDMENVEGFFQGDDLGFKTSTFLSPEQLRQLVIPWHKKFAEIAHQKGKMYWFHCCGNVLELMDDFIYDVKIDAFHSFQDEIIPVWEFKEKYGEKIAVLGGVDVDKLCNFDEESLRKYVREILDKCMPERYALGSGNSIANYVPPENYLIMIDEGEKYCK
ncbi:uroporphyrinogen-III decarboxylase-like protein [bacterium]|nr:uroporphyrinogen-III decarboxylase-like protein [bacterium]